MRLRGYRYQTQQQKLGQFIEVIASVGGQLGASMTGGS
jgi:hypothetical protein